MNKFIYLFLFFTIISYCQNNYKAIYFTSIKDAEGVFDYSYDSELIFNNHESKYIEKYIFDADTLQFIIYKNYKKNYFELKFEESPDIIVIDTIKGLNWEIFDESKTINNLLCYKARTSFRGRNYVAWFTTELKTLTGPYKFHGLPGLILEITDNINIFIKILSLEKVQESLYSEYSTKKKEIYLKDYLKIKDLEFDELIKKSKASLPREVTSYEVQVNKNSQIEKKYEWEDK